jgi:hypothetical protein
MNLSPALRRAYIEVKAEEEGILVHVPPADATSWRAEWKRLVRLVVKPRIAKPRPPSALALPYHIPAGHRQGKPRAIPLPVQMGIPGTWLRFRPHAPHPVPPHIYQVVAVVPPGVGLLDVLTADQFALLDRHILPGPSPRFTRVVVSVQGARRASGTLRAVLAGELAARAEIIDAPEGNESGTRLSAPLLSGSEVTWGWHSPHGRIVHSGVVLAYVPADTSIHDLLPGLHLSYGLHLVSNQDRYVVRLTSKSRKPILTPAAHLVERGILEVECSSNCETFPVAQ